MSAPPPPEASRRAAAQARGEPAAEVPGRGGRAATVRRRLGGPAGGPRPSRVGGRPRARRERRPETPEDARSPGRHVGGGGAFLGGRPPHPPRGLRAPRSPTTRACGRCPGPRRAGTRRWARRRRAGLGGPRREPCKMEAASGPVYTAQQMAAGAAERADCENLPRGRVCRDDATPRPRGGRGRGAAGEGGPRGREAGAAVPRAGAGLRGEKGKSARAEWEREVAASTGGVGAAVRAGGRAALAGALTGGSGGAPV